MPEIELTWGRVLSVWWLVLWRGAIGGLLLGGVIGFIVGVFGIILSWPSGLRTGVAIGGGLVINVIWGLVVLRMALAKHYRGFRLALLA